MRKSYALHIRTPDGVLDDAVTKTVDSSLMVVGSYVVVRYAGTTHRAQVAMKGKHKVLVITRDLTPIEKIMSVVDQCATGSLEGVELTPAGLRLVLQRTIEQFLPATPPSRPLFPDEYPLSLLSDEERALYAVPVEPATKQEPKKKQSFEDILEKARRDHNQEMEELSRREILTQLRPAVPATEPEPFDFGSLLGATPPEWPT